MSIPKSITNGRNPTYLDPRYEIRQLTVAHIPWAAALVIHSNMFHSPVWPMIYPDEKTKRLQQGMAATDYLIRHQIESGMSFGIFDKQYDYKRPESALTQGKLYWDPNDVKSDGASLLQQMDFPLVSVALSYDASNPLDMQRLTVLVEILPLFGTLYGVLESLDRRDPTSWKATGPHEVLMRNGTATRPDYEGRGLTRKMANWLMREAADQGYRGIQIETAHDAVTHTWLHPPKPFQAELIAELDMATYEQENEAGKRVCVFEPSKQVCAKIYVSLKGSHDGPSGVNGYATQVSGHVGAPE
jgi:GNAT superfamily N-acetyltransferase